jgi:hypothetical protein
VGDTVSEHEPVAPQDCTTPEYHETHRYCPTCTWTEDDDWKPRYLVRKAPGVGGNPIPHDEPVIVIRGQDALAVLMLDLYVLLYMDTYRTRADRDVINELAQHRAHLVDWQHANVDKVKRADR